MNQRTCHLCGKENFDGGICAVCKDKLNATDLCALARRMGFTVEERGRNHYTLKEHDSLIIFARDNSWRRFSDDSGGDAISFVMYWQQCDFREACDRLNDFACILPVYTPPPPEPEPEPLPPDLHLRYHQALTAEDRAWWREHYGLSDTAIRHYQLGVAHDHPWWAPVTYTVPILVDGKLVSLKHRIPGAPQGQKYRSHQKGLGTHLFNCDRLTSDLRGVVIVAGELKAITLEDYGIPAVSTTGGCGHWDSRWNDRLHHCNRIFIAYDPDPPTEQEHARKLAAELGTRARLVDCPLKPDDYVREHGPEMLRGLLKTARTLSQVQAWDAALVQARQMVRI